MNVIFLDYNGVLDTYENMDVTNRENLLRLKNIVLETNSKIVISSSLKNSYYYTGHFTRHLSNIIKEMQEEDIEIIGITPKAENRQEEIQLYLETHPEVENFCIIDDDYFMERFSNHMVKLPNQIIPGQSGLDDYHMNIAINILKGNNKSKKK